MYDNRSRRFSRPGTVHPAERSSLHRIGRETGGSALVEFGLTIPVILMVLFGIVEFGSLSFARITVRHAVVEATRFAVTGNQLTDPDDDQALLSRIASIQQMVHDRATHVTVQSISISPADGGGPEEIVTITVDFTYEFFLPGFKNVLDPVDFSVSTSMRNEPFLPSGDGS